MRDQHHRLAALAPDALEIEIHLLARHGVEGAERLVHQQNARIVDECSTDGRALLHAARQLHRILVAEVVEADHGEQLLRTRARCGLFEPLHLHGQHDVLEDRAPRQQNRALEHHTDVAPRRLHRGSVEQH